MVNGNLAISATFHAHICTYNNVFAFISYGVKYDKVLCSNDKSIYTFRVQGMVHYFIETLVPSNVYSTNLQLYFYETENELAN